MMSTSRRSAVSLLVALASPAVSVALSSCSLVNAVDDVKERSTAPVVMAGVSSSQHKLWVVDARTGALIGRPEVMAVSSVIHDPFADVWFIFENLDANGEDPRQTGATTRVRLHARKLDTKTGIFSSDLGPALDVKPNLTGTSAVLRGRLVYLTFTKKADGTELANAIAVVDTSNPASLRAASDVAGGVLELGTDELFAQNVLTTPAFDDVGGQVNVIWGSGCQTDSCSLNRMSLSLPDGKVTRSAAFATYPKSTSAGYGSSWISGANLFALPSEGKAVVRHFSARDYGTSTGVSAEFELGTQIRPLAVDECGAVAFAVDLKTPALAAVSLKSEGVAPGLATIPGSSGLAVVFEPVTKQVLVLEKATSGTDVVAFEVAASERDVVLTKTPWPQYSRQLKPELIAVAGVSSCR